MKFEYHPQKPNIAEAKKELTEIEFEMMKRCRESAEQNLEIWNDSLQAVMEDLAAVEAKEGPLDPEDPRLIPVKICAMRADEAKTMLRDLKEEREEVVNRAQIN